jgi:Tfp pilus assembly protein PilF
MAIGAEHTAAASALPHATPPARSVRFLGPVLFSVAATVLILNIAGAISPSGLNWGFHAFGFIPPVIAIALFFLIALLFLGPVQEKITSLLGKVVHYFHAKDPWVRRMSTLIGLTASGIIFWLMREKTFLLGDGNLKIRAVRDVVQVSDIPAIFNNEPMAGLLYWKVRQLLLPAGLLPNDEFAIQLVTTLCGVFTLAALWYIAEELLENIPHRILLFVFMIGSGVTQFFFGYVEVYPPLYLFFVLLVLSLIRWEKNYLSVIYPSVIYGVLFSLHFGMIMLLPVMMVVWFCEARRTSVLHVVAACGAALVTSVLLLWLCGFSVPSFINAFTGRERHILTVDPGTAYWSVYGFFSWFHLLDLINIIILISPMAVPILLVFPLTAIGRTTLQGWTGIILFLCALCGLVFTTIVNPELGMARDWDLFATYLSSAVFCAAFFLSVLLKNGILTGRIMILLAGISFIPTAVFVSTNAQEKSSVRRCAALLDPRIMGRHAVLTGLEEIAVYYRGVKDVGRSAEYYEKYLSIDSSRDRIWMGLAHLYELSGDEAREATVYERAIRHGVAGDEIVVNLAGLYVQKGRIPEASNLLKQAVDAHPDSPEMNRSYGSFLLNYSENYTAALGYFRQAIALDSSSADAWYNAGICSFRTNDSAGMKYYFEKFLHIEPFGTDANRVRRLLAGETQELN